MKVTYSKYSKLLVLVVAIVVLYFTFKRYVNFTKNDTTMEGFTGQTKKFETKQGELVYDNFYSKIYDELTFNDAKMDYEISEILRATKANKKNDYILDIGCGTGGHCALLKERGFNVEGIDKSLSMINRAKYNYDGIKFSMGDMMTPMLYEHGRFSHILCMYFTIYYIKNKALFFDNCYNWLKNGGYLILHLVDREKFNPILPAADPLFLVSPQKYSKERITKSLVKFNGFQYKADFKLNSEQNKATFDETFIDDKTSKVRKNIHEFYMENHSSIINLAKECGFILHGKIDLMPVQYDYQYLYVLYKPN